ncbi:MAG TPA: hemerythrin domain-containing protein [Candidatus Limnocylindria bacterium]|nr:hemerythrin domain-containing protein [Candidatus Limnocylindria bacterium]
MRIIDRFSAEHVAYTEQLDRLVRLVDEGGDVAVAIAAARTLATPLLKHAENEEVLLFPDLIARMGGEGPVQVLQEEHRIIHGQVSRLIGEPTRADFATVFAAFDKLLREHIAKEEYVVFPMSAELLGDARLSEMDAEVSAAV